MIDSAALRQLFVLTVVTFLMVWGPRASAQSSSNEYTVYVPPYMTLQQFRPDRTANHPGTSADVQMGSSLWVARTTSLVGSTVTLSTDHSFWNLAHPAHKRDAFLRVPVFFGLGGWTLNNAADQTDYAIGKEVATVELQSSGPGFAWIPLEVTFLTGDVNTLAGGQYQMTVIGTITEN